MVEPIDTAHQRFVELREEVASYLDSVNTEADARLKIIDRVFTEVLLWPYVQILAEDSTPAGFADYSFNVNDRSRLIVEAKRDSRSLGCEARHARRGYKLNGGLFNVEAAKEGISQAIRYCGEKNAELACVTNGREWIIFRGNRLGDGMDTRDGSAFVYANLVTIEENFEHFYNLLSFEAAKSISYRPYFQEAEGQPIRMSVFHNALRPQGTAKFLPSGDLSGDVDKVMATFFQRLTGDEDSDLIKACFVATNESRYADTQLARIADNLATKIKDIDSEHAEGLSKLVKRITDTRRHEFVVLVGTKGAGKSTFVTRFFDDVLPKSTAQQCVVLKIDLADSPGDVSNVVPWLDQAFLTEAERQLFPDGPPSFNDLTGMFYDDYTRLKQGPWAQQYAADHQQFLIKFGEWLEDKRNSKANEYFEGLLRHVVTNRKMVPVVIFDNTDHFAIEFQQQVYQYARSLFERVLCLVLLPITDRTSWQLAKHGALQSFEHEAFFLPTPPTEQVIKKRIEFLESRIDATRERPEDRYFVAQGISLSIPDLTAFTRTLQTIFLQTSDISQWIGDLANHDIRRTLTLARQFVGSPHLGVGDLLKAYIARSAVEVNQIYAQRALIRGHYDVYPTGQQDFVQNLYCLNSDLETTPLLGVRILQLLADVPVTEHHGALIEVDRIGTYCAGMNVEIRATQLWLNALLKAGLIISYDPSMDDIEDAGQVEISPAGKHHLLWAKGEFEYVSAMAQATPLLDESVFRTLEADVRSQRWRMLASHFIGYLLQEDKMYCSTPDHQGYQSQLRVAAGLDAVRDRLERPRARSRY
jgi:energy-coupling factor transporter ATP-binding protein EcfA2